MLPNKIRKNLSGKKADSSPNGTQVGFEAAFHCRRRAD